jgi:hypothetical protein
LNIFFDVFAGTLTALIVFVWLLSLADAQAKRQRERAEQRAFENQLKWEEERQRRENEAYEARRARINAEFEARDRRIFDQMIVLDIPQIKNWANGIAEHWGWPKPEFGDREASAVNIPFDDPKLTRAGELNHAANGSRNLREWLLYRKTVEYGVMDAKEIDALIDKPGVTKPAP